MKYLLVIFVLLFQNSLSAEPYNSKSLKTTDYEEMRDILNKYIKSSQDSLSETGEGADSAVSELKKGLKILLMKPNTGALKTSLILTLQNEIIKYRSFMAVLQEVVETALSEFKAKKGSVAYQASLLYLIENSLSYLNSINNKESNKILKNIKNARIKASEKVISYLLLEMERGKSASPSYLAGQILKKREKELKKKAEAQKKAKQKEQAKKTAKKKKRRPSSKKSEKPSKSTIKINL